MILIRLRSNMDPEIILEGSEEEIIKEIHKRDLEDWHDAYFYERDKFENLGLTDKFYDYYVIYENEEEMNLFIFTQPKKDIEKLYIEALDKNLSPSVFANQILNLFDNPWLSPIKSEREQQEKNLKKIYIEYPKTCNWQLMNGLIDFACKYLNIEKEK
jgi:hypothetical protein